ncbi:XRE family transcriptional regulator [Xaviernesmea oryzae]|uniref:XRE family transcriptional regulator n=1 Tax=Xaviernesmea oryzae TaxID=464029 RepID=A0A1Q9ASL3_9HYPH|nr:helix-turn-helix transcriptional regulator [Xaviernesmea oryzae]OLP58351.1 XRE family transcriptional regulator [Xaviernesmea oryzae]SEL40844.1 Predicted DNA-binding protein, contains XRE-type HTH domain [Xaviernesmea oryzae]
MNDDFELIRGSGNVFRDLGYHDADLRHARAVLAAEIIKALDERQWSTRKAEQETGISHADFSRIRRANIERFSFERLASILGALGREVEVSVEVRPRVQPGAPAEMRL